jgi:hypothetical protein
MEEITLKIIFLFARFRVVRRVPQTALKHCLYFKYRTGQNSVVSIATGYGLDDREVGVRVPVGSSI